MDYTNELNSIYYELQNANGSLTNIDTYLYQNLTSNNNILNQKIDGALYGINNSGETINNIAYIRDNIELQNQKIETCTNLIAVLCMIMATYLIYNFIVRCFK